VARSTKVLSISVPERLAEELERMAVEEGVSRSELFRSMVKAYKRERAAAEFLELQRRLAPKAQERGIKTEEDVDRIVFEDR
jgi:metal-responsive CopG/Arc/MetJ family transcriptional regulator